MKLSAYLCCSALLLSALLPAQTVSGLLSGVVVENAASPLSGAKVELVQSSRDFLRTAITGADGQFRFTTVPPGVYQLRVARDGYAAAPVQEVEVQVGAEARLEVQLQRSADGNAGGPPVSMSVTVADRVDDISRAMTTGSRGAVFTEADLDRLPAVAGRTSRNYSSQVFLLPGTVNSRTPHAPFSINGQRGQSTVNVMVDGADFNNANTGSLLGVNFTEQPVSQEALRTVEVQSSSYKAEYGRSAAGSINLVTPSGSNEWHGKFYEFFRNDALDARNTLNAERASLRQNQFGTLLTGPIVRNRLFFALNAEWMIQRAANSSVPQATFSAAERATAAPSVSALLQHYPLPNATSPAGVPLFDPGRVGERQLGRTWFGRLDYVISSRHLLTGRVTNAESLRRAQDLFATGSAGWNQNRSGALHLTSTLSPRLVNEARAYYTTFQVPLWPLTRFLGNPALNGTVGLVNVTGAARLGTFFRDDSRTHNYQVSNDTSWSTGRHSVKFGVIARAVQVNTTQRADGDGVYNFLSRADFLAGRPATYTRVLGDTRLDQRQQELGLYIQDDIRLRPNLTVNAGLRYEFYTPAEDLFDRVRVNYSADRNNFAPRVGFAWTPGGSKSGRGNQNLVIRGGYGLFYAPLAARYLGNTRLTPPRVSTVIARNPQMANPLGGPLTQSLNLTQTDAALRQPYTQQWNLTADYRLPGTGLVASVGYVATRGTALPLTRLPNGGALLAQDLRPDPTLGVVTLLETAANSHLPLAAGHRERTGDAARDGTQLLHLVQVDRRREPRLGQHLRSAQPPAGSRGERVRHSVGVYLGRGGGSARHDAMEGLGQSRLGWLAVDRSQHLAGGFSVQHSVRRRHAGRCDRQPDQQPARHDCAWPAGRLRPATRTGADAGAVAHAGAACRQPVWHVRPQYRTGRGVLRPGPGLQKEFTVTERVRLQWRMEAFNALNTVNYETYAGNIADPRFGQAITAAPPRAVQLMIRLTF